MGLWQYTNDELREELWWRGKNGDAYSDYRERLDSIDDKMLREIIQKFHTLNWQERKDMYNLIFGDGKL